MFDLTLSTLLIRLVVLIPILAVYGLTLCAAARLLGDEGPSQDGRLTANPVVHLDMLGALAFLLSGLGWISPLHLTPERLRGGIVGMIAAPSAAGVALLILAWLAQRLIPFAINMESLAWGAILANGLQMLSASAIMFALVNLVPLPPLAAGAVLGRTSAIAAWLERRRLLVSVALVVVFASGKIQDWLAPVVTSVLSSLD